MAKVLFVEDDNSLAGMVLEWLKHERHYVEWLNDGIRGQERLKVSQYDLIILDWKLPGVSGLNICRDYRLDGGITPIIMLTGMNTITNKEVGLDAGADDYLTKPFSLKELTARIRALLRRPVSPPSDLLKVKNITLDSVKYKATKDNVEIHLLPKEFSLLEFFMRHPDETFSSANLLKRVWHSENESSSEAVRTCIKRLRKKIDNKINGDLSLIRTIPRIGYRLQI